MSDCLPPSRTPTPLPRRDMSQNAPLSVPLLGNTLEMETRTASLVTMEAATDKESVAAFVEETLAGSGWEGESIRHRVDRVDPPNSYWSVFAVEIYKDGEERDLRLVARGALNPEAWEKLSARLERHGAGNPCDPINGIGYPRLFPDTWHAYWFYPYDLSMSNLPLANDPIRMAAVLLGLDKPEDMLAGARHIEVERVRYLPEVSAILRYTIDVGGSRNVIFGKVQPGRRGLRTNGIVEGLWQASAKYPGFLKLPRPLGYVEEMNMLIEEGIPGKPLGGSRTSARFMVNTEEFTLLDFDYYATAETSYAWGKFGASLVPSRPKAWRDSVAVEEGRVRFIRRYRELRPHATLHRFGVYEALQFALRAMSAMWMQKPGWHRVAETYLVLGFERLKSRLPE